MAKTKKKIRRRKLPGAVARAEKERRGELIGARPGQKLVLGRGRARVETVKRNPRKQKLRSGTAKPRKKTARGAVNIKVNVLSRNPAKRRRPTPRPAPRLKRKDNRARFMIIANKQGGDRLYWTGVGGEFTDARHRAVLYTSFREASKKARSLISKGLAPSVKSLQVKRY